VFSTPHITNYGQRPTWAGEVSGNLLGRACATRPWRCHGVRSLKKKKMICFLNGVFEKVWNEDFFNKVQLTTLSRSNF
jgi:hypothetical protein